MTKYQKCNTDRKAILRLLLLQCLNTYCRDPVTCWSTLDKVLQVAKQIDFWSRWFSCPRSHASRPGQPLSPDFTFHWDLNHSLCLPSVAALSFPRCFHEDLVQIPDYSRIYLFLLTSSMKLITFLFFLINLCGCRAFWPAGGFHVRTVISTDSYAAFPLEWKTVHCLLHNYFAVCACGKINYSPLK